MIENQTKHRLETRLAQLIEGMLAGKESAIDFMIGLNRLDDILILRETGNTVTTDLIGFLTDYRHWLNEGVLDKTQKGRAGRMLNRLGEALAADDTADSLKLVEEIKDWVKTLGGGAFRLTLHGTKEQASLADRFCALLHREAEEMNMLLAESDHLLTCLDDLLDSAEHRTDPIYNHLAASLIYFLKREGYKVDPYVKRLRRTRAEG